MIEQIVADTEAGYLVERSRWKEEADKRDYFKDAGGSITTLHKHNMGSGDFKDNALMKRNDDWRSGERTDMWKSAITDGLKYCLDNKEFAPADVAESIRLELEDTAHTATVKPKDVVEICKQYIQSILAIAKNGMDSYKSSGPSFKEKTYRTQLSPTAYRTGTHKRDILLLAKTIKSPEFLAELKKRVGRRLFNPLSWFKSVEKPNTKGRLADV